MRYYPIVPQSFNFTHREKARLYPKIIESESFERLFLLHVLFSSASAITGLEVILSPDGHLISAAFMCAHGQYDCHGLSKVCPHCYGTTPPKARRIQDWNYWSSPEGCIRELRMEYGHLDKVAAL